MPDNPEPRRLEKAVGDVLLLVPPEWRAAAADKLEAVAAIVSAEATLAGLARENATVREMTERIRELEAALAARERLEAAARDLVEYWRDSGHTTGARQWALRDAVDALPGGSE